MFRDIFHHYGLLIFSLILWAVFGFALYFVITHWAISPSQLIANIF